MRGSIRWLLPALLVALAVAAPAGADSNPAKDLCKNAGFADFTTVAGGAPFSNQGQCVSFVNQGGTLVPVVQGPEITGFSPSTFGSNCPVVITGSGFTGTLAVTFNNTPASFTVDSDTQITATSPVPTTDGVIEVTTPGGTASSEPYQTSGTVCGDPLPS
jgi:hypothetical protein